MGIETKSSTEYTCDEINTILKQRAARLAEKKDKSVDSGHLVSVIECELHSERYGIELDYVKSVSEIKNFTRIPGVPDFIAGVVNIHGHIVCIVNLKSLFNIPQKDISDLNRIIILNYEDIELGILADRIGEIKKISMESLQRGFSVNNEMNEAFIKGIASAQLIILDIPKLLINKEIIVNQV